MSATDSTGQVITEDCPACSGTGRYQGNTCPTCTIENPSGPGRVDKVQGQPGRIPAENVTYNHSTE